MTKFSQAVANKQAVATQAKETKKVVETPKAELSATVNTTATSDTVVSTPIVEQSTTASVPTEKAPAFVPVDTPETSEEVTAMQERIEQLEKMVRSVSDRNAVEKFDDSQKGKGNTRYAIPLYEGKVVRAWNYKNERDVKLRGADADNSVTLEMYDGTKIELTYQMWVKTMYVSEQIPHVSTSNKNGITLITFSFQAEDDESPTIYEIDKRYLNAR